MYQFLLTLLLNLLTTNILKEIIKLDLIRSNHIIKTMTSSTNTKELPEQSKKKRGRRHSAPEQG